MKFQVDQSAGSARTGWLEFRRGRVRTPAFMPVGTYGSVKSVTPEEVAGSGAEIILGNTFHLMLRPGTDIVRKHGGLHEFMHWTGPKSSSAIPFIYSCGPEPKSFASTVACMNL